MAKNDRSTFLNQYNQQRGQQQSGQNQIMGNLYGQLYGYGAGGQPNQSSLGGGGLYGQGQTERQNLISGYQGLSGLAPDVVNNLRNIQTPQIPTTGGAYGGYQGLTAYNPQFSLDPGLVKQIQSGIGNLQNTQWNPQDVSQIRNSIGGLTGNIAGYQNFADTGGLTPTDVMNFRARSNAPVGAYYQSQQNELERLANQSQGNPYAIAANRANLARQGSQQLSDVSQGTEANLTNLINQGKLAGLGGAQQGLATQAQLANQLAQGQAASQLYGQQAGLQGLQNLLGTGLGAQESAAQLGLQGRLAGLQGMSDIDRSNLSAQLAGNQLRSGNEQFIGSQNLGSQLAGLQGLQGLYSQVHGPSAIGQQQLLGQFNQGNANQNQLLQLLLSGLSGIPSNNQQLFGNILGGIGSVGGLLTGLGGFR